MMFWCDRWGDYSVTATEHGSYRITARHTLARQTRFTFAVNGVSSPGQQHVYLLTIVPAEVCVCVSVFVCVRRACVLACRLVCMAYFLLEHMHLLVFAPATEGAYVSMRLCKCLRVCTYCVRTFASQVFPCAFHFKGIF